MAAARSLWEKGHWRQSLFFAHLGMEKLLKAHFTSQKKEVPPRIHNLKRLADMAGLALTPDQKEFLRVFSMYQLEGRYPGSVEVLLDQDSTRKELTRAQEMLEWLIRAL